MPRLALIAFFVFLSGCASVKPPSEPTPSTLAWYSGHFTGDYADARSTSDFSVTCSAVPDCETTIQEITPRRIAPQKILSKSAPRVSVDILNTNLRSVQSAVAAHPERYKDANEGPLLRRLRPVIDSGGRFTECLGVAPDGGNSIALCLHSDGKQQVPVLLFSTMKPTCTDGAFCAYYVMPLVRQK